MFIWCKLSKLSIALLLKSKYGKLVKYQKRGLKSETFQEFPASSVEFKKL